MLSWFSRWLRRREFRRNIGKFVRFNQYCEFGISVHDGQIIGVLENSYVIRSQGIPRTAWFHDVEFITK